LIVGNAFFVLAEFGLMAVRRSAMEPLADEGSRRASIVLAAQDRLTDVLSCAQLGITVCSTGLGALAEPAVAGLVAGPMARLGLGSVAAHAVAGVFAVLLVVYLHVVVGEMVPKNLALATPERVALALAGPILGLTRALSPVVRALGWVANLLVRLVGVRPTPEVTSAFTAEEVAAIVQLSSEEGVLDDSGGVLAGTLEFDELTAGDVLVPVESVVTVPAGASPADVERQVAVNGFSRFPVAGDGGEISGYVHIMDIVDAEGVGREAPISRERIRPLVAVEESVALDDALVAMQASRAHMVRVTRQGRVIGILFMEDVLEELVGEVRDSVQRPQAKVN